MLSRSFILLIIYIISLWPGDLIAQDKASWIIQSGVAGGTIIKNYPTFPEHGLALFSVTEIMKKSNGEKPWHHYYKFPETGLKIIFGTPGNSDILGNMTAVLPQISFQYNDWQKNQLFIKLATGIAWFSKPYHYLDNPDNTLIGSAFTNLSSIHLSYVHKLNESWAINAGFGLFHYSNGHTQIPNVGMNIPIIETGIRYTSNPGAIRHKIQSDTILKNEAWFANFKLVGGWHEMGATTQPTHGIKYPVYGLGIGINKNSGRINRWYLGLDCNYYTSFRDFITHQEIFEDNTFMNSSSMILYAGHEFIIGHLGLDTQAGIYLWNPLVKKLYASTDFLKTISSNKLGINYYLFAPEKNIFNLYFGLHIKANFGQADFIEFTTGVVF
ncbi:MAG: acyloxyacyl hydrolase [Bacteroidales bacterium]|nr:acyloxyacyl hydrolase [Bacteroidales bacterium]